MPLKIYRKKGQEFQELTLFYIDHSFDYRDCFGGINRNYEPSGIEFALDKYDMPILEFFKGFGHFEDLNKCKTYAQVYEYLLDLITEINSGVYKKAYNPYEDVEHWTPVLIETKNGCLEMMKPRRKAA